MTVPTPGRQVRLLSPGVAALLATSAGCFWIWYARYGGVDFNELGRYFDEEAQVVYTDAAFVWCLPGIALLLAAVSMVAYRLWRRRVHRAG